MGGVPETELKPDFLHRQVGVGQQLPGLLESPPRIMRFGCESVGLYEQGVELGTPQTNLLQQPGF
jgi:hypothetical protein